MDNRQQQYSDDCDITQDELQPMPRVDDKHVECEACGEVLEVERAIQVPDSDPAAGYHATLFYCSPECARKRT